LPPRPIGDREWHAAIRDRLAINPEREIGIILLPAGDIPGSLEDQSGDTVRELRARLRRVEGGRTGEDAAVPLQCQQQLDDSQVLIGGEVELPDFQIDVGDIAPTAAQRASHLR